MQKILTLVVLFVAISLITQAQVDRYPVIQSPSQTSVVIAWNTATAGVGTVNWGTTAGSLTNTLTEPASTKIHVITITGLQPNTQYYYKATTSAGFASSVEYFYTAKPDSVRNLKFNVYGDCGFNNSQQNTMAALMATQTTDFSLVVGDVDQNVGDDYDARFFQRYKDQLKHTCHFTAIGNHDVITNNTNYTDAFVLPHNNPANSEKYYSFTWGNAKFITIDGNSAYTQGSAQYIWLENELKCNNSEWTFVYFHQPPWSNGWDVSYYIPLTPFYHYQGNTDMRTSIVPLFEQYHVDFVLNGHTHHYESGQYHGVHYIISGGGGASTNDTHTNSNSPNIQFEDDVDNYVNFTINGDSLKYVAIDINGNHIDSVTLTKNYTPYSETIAATDAHCFGGNDGAINLQVTGPHPSYSYAWSNGNNTASPSQLAAGSYTVSITDAFGCVRTDNAVVDEPTQIVATPTITQPLCYGSTNGAINVAVNGGTGAYQYNWSNSATTANINNLGAGQYTLVIQDANQCGDTLQTTVNQPAALVSALAVTNPLCHADTSDMVTLTATGGTAGYTYLWSNGNTTNQLTSVPAGTYYVTVTDANSCLKTDSATVVAPTAITALPTVTDAPCGPGSTGAISVAVSGGTSPYSYLWNNGDTTANISNVPSAQYTLAIQDGNGCLDTVTAAVNQGTNVAVQVDTVGLTCNGDHSGAINLVPSGGVGPYTYHWSTGASTQNLTNLAAGTYGATVTDANGCNKITSAVVLQPAPLAGSPIVTPITCNGSANGAITAAVSGGTYPYSYNWSNGESTSNISNLAPGQYTVYIADDHGCLDTITQTLSQPPGISATSIISAATCNGSSDGNAYLTVSGGVMPYTYAWSNNATTQSVTVGAGTYDATITDAHGCTRTVQAVVTEPTAIQVLDSVKNSLCTNNNGKVTLQVSGGSTPYTYNWSNNANPNALSAGSYTLTVTDAHNCTTTRNYTILQQGGDVRPTLAYYTNQLCQGDSEAVQIASPFATYQWNTGEQTAFIYASTSGDYYATATDSFGCTVYSDTLSLTVNTITHEQVTATTSLLTAHLEASQPNANSYVWNLGNGQSVTDSSGQIDYTYADSGSYTVQLVSMFDCGNDTTEYIVHVSDSATGILVLSGKAINVSIEPNPFSETATLIFDQATNQTFKLRLYNVEGKLLRDLGYSTGTTFTIHRGNLASGVYLLNVTGQQYNATLKLIVE